jgi:hypothetical protein
MTCYMFQLTISSGAHGRLRQLNEEYGPILAKVAGAIDGLRGIEKWVLGDTYVERIDFDGEFADFARQLSADKEVRQFLRSVDGCFTQSLKEMTDRAMTCLQALPG